MSQGLALFDATEAGKIPAGLCQCGCGQRTKPIACTDLKQGRIAGQPAKFVKGHNKRTWIFLRAEQKGLRYCRDCKKEMPPTEFYPGARNNPCKKCGHKRQVEDRRSQPIRAKEIDRRRTLKYEFGITPEQYCAMLQRQNGLCAICQNPESVRNGVTNAPRKLAVDHDHTTGRVRDLLCQKCNTALGKFRENPMILERAIAYLEKHKQWARLFDEAV